VVKVFVGDELRDALRLTSLIGRDRARHFVPGQHPLGGGIAALDKELAGRSELTLEEKYSLGSLKLVAETVFQQERHWVPHRDRFLGQLRKASYCEAILFEIEVIRFGVAPKVESLDWPIYRQGERDVRTYGPDMLIECKLPRSRGANSLEKSLTRAKNQPRPRGIPLVVAIGLAGWHFSGRHEQVTNLVNSLTSWFETHPEVSAALFFTRLDRPLPALQIGGVATELRPIYLGDIVEFVNLRANNPLPRGFTFRW